MEVEELYDEFGNYVGPEQSDSDSGSLQLPDLGAQKNGPDTDARVDSANGGTVDANITGGSALAPTTRNGEAAGQTAVTDAIVLAEDKQYYPSAEDVFGPNTEVLVEEEDAHAITEPIIAPVYEPSSGLHESEDTIPPAKYSRAYLTSAILSTPALIRNVALVGHLHHGKSSFADMLFEASHEMPWDGLDDRDLPVRYMDMRRDERALHMSLKTSAATLLLQNSVEKSYGVTLLDTPGHVNFFDECVAALSLADGAIVLVDVAEGVMMGTELILRKAALMSLDIVLVISKLDRLCLELRLPPADAYHKIRHIVESVNDIIVPLGAKTLSPPEGNVAFASSNERVCFTLKQFARKYVDAHGGSRNFPLAHSELARRFWGDYYYDRETRKFSREGAGPRTFVEFIMTPFYKLHTAVLSEDADELAVFMDRNSLLGSKGRGKRITNGYVNRKALDLDVRPLLKEACSNVYGMGDLAGLVDMLAEHVGSPVERVGAKIGVMRQTLETEENRPCGPKDEWEQSLAACDTEDISPMTAYVGKLLPDEKGLHFDCLLRVLSGQMQVGDSIRVLGDYYNARTNSEDQATAVISAIYVPCARFKIEVDRASAGQIVLVRGVDRTVMKSATVVSAQHSLSEFAVPLKPLTDFLPTACVKVAVEPIRPSELPKMVASLRQCVKSFPGLKAKVEESGEHTLIGSGELYMDCVLRDLREAYGKIEVKVSDPVVPFSETVSETSALQCYAKTPNRHNKIVMVAEPLEESILISMEDGTLAESRNPSETLRSCGWDALAARSLWAFGPDPSRGPNALLNDVLIQESRQSADIVRGSIVEGFSWAMREGPLADEPVRSVKVRLLDACIADREVLHSRAQIMPSCRRAVYSSMLTANPRLMEPVFKTEIISATEALSAAYMLVGRRRGVVLAESEVAGTPLMRLEVHMPVLDAYGFEPDLRNLTHGAAFCSQVFSHWGMLPGDPLDKSVELRPLEPAGRRELARECMVKTRRRKGMGDNVSITKYFDDPLLAELAKDNEELQRLL